MDPLADVGMNPAFIKGAHDGAGYGKGARLLIKARGWTCKQGERP
jgi:hypothetical protein